MRATGRLSWCSFARVNTRTSSARDGRIFKTYADATPRRPRQQSSERPQGRNPDSRPIGTAAGSPEEVANAIATTQTAPQARDLLCLVNDVGEREAVLLGEAPDLRASSGRRSDVEDRCRRRLRAVKYFACQLIAPAGVSEQPDDHAPSANCGHPDRAGRERKPSAARAERASPGDGRASTSAQTRARPVSRGEGRGCRAPHSGARAAANVMGELSKRRLGRPVWAQAVPVFAPATSAERR